MPSPFVPQGEGIRKGFQKKLRPVCQTQPIKIGKSLAPGRAAGGIFNLAASGGKVSHLESGLRMRFAPSFLGSKRNGLRRAKKSSQLEGNGMESRLNNERRIAKAGQDARRFYDNGTMCCSEAVLSVINKGFGGGLPQGLVISLSKGFCGGIGDVGCVCGAVAGAVMAQSLILGKGPQPAEDEQVRKASRELHDRFIALYGCTCCRVLCRDRDPNSESKGPCLDYVESAASICARLLLEPASPGLGANDFTEKAVL